MLLIFGCNFKDFPAHCQFAVRLSPLAQKCERFIGLFDYRQYGTVIFTDLSAL
jgi:hypothetical protein